MKLSLATTAECTMFLNAVSCLNSSSVLLTRSRNSTSIVIYRSIVIDVASGDSIVCRLLVETYLHTGLAQINAQAVRILAVVLHEILQIPESGSPGDEKATLVQLADTIMLHRVAVPHCNANNYRYIPLWRFKRRSCNFLVVEIARSTFHVPVSIIIHLFDIILNYYDTTDSFYYRPE